MVQEHDDVSRYIPFLFLCSVSILMTVSLLIFMLAHWKMMKLQYNKIFFSYLFTACLSSIFRIFYHGHKFRQTDDDKKKLTVADIMEVMFFLYIIDCITALLSMLHLVAVSVDRLLMIKFPMYYRMHVDGSTTIKIIIGIWTGVIAVFLTNFALYYTEHYDELFHLILLLPMIFVFAGVIFMSGSNILVTWVAVRQFSKNNHTHEPLSLTSSTLSTTTIKVSKADMRAAVICALIVANFCVTYIPSLVLGLNIYICQCHCCHDLEWAMSFLLVIAPSTDAIIYSAFNPDIRAAIGRYLHKGAPEGRNVAVIPRNYDFNNSTDTLRSYIHEESKTNDECDSSRVPKVLELKNTHSNMANGIEAANEEDLNINNEEFTEEVESRRDNANKNQKLAFYNLIPMECLICVKSARDL